MGRNLLSYKYRIGWGFLFFPHCSASFPFNFLSSPPFLLTINFSLPSHLSPLLTPPLHIAPFPTVPLPYSSLSSPHSSLPTPFFSLPFFYIPSPQFRTISPKFIYPFASVFIKFPFFFPNAASSHENHPSSSPMPPALMKIILLLPSSPFPFFPLTHPLLFS